MADIKIVIDKNKNLRYLLMCLGGFKKKIDVFLLSWSIPMWDFVIILYLLWRIVVPVFTEKIFEYQYALFSLVPSKHERHMQQENLSANIKTTNSTDLLHHEEN
jgi:hypothetical protein